jgi:prepilin-type N-terminal cleavage/methylation domain-containing protein
MFFTERKQAVKKNRKTGFTLVELLVVIAIIALLLSVLIPSMNRAKEIAKRVVCGSGLKGVGSAMSMYADAYDNKMPTDRAIACGATKEWTDMHSFLVYRNDYRTCDKSVDPAGKLIPFRWACLFEKKYISDPKIFYCAGNPGKDHRYDSYIDPPPWGTLPQKYNDMKDGDKNQWVRIGYSYFPTDSTAKLIKNMLTSYKYRDPNCAVFDRLDRSIPYATDLLWSRGSLSHKSGIRKAADDKVVVLNPGINALFKDGHVVYASDRMLFTDDRTVEAGVVWLMMENKTFTTSNGGYNVFHYTIFKNIQP